MGLHNANINIDQIMFLHETLNLVTEAAKKKEIIKEIAVAIKEAQEQSAKAQELIAEAKKSQSQSVEAATDADVRMRRAEQIKVDAQKAVEALELKMSKDAVESKNLARQQANLVEAQEAFKSKCKEEKATLEQGLAKLRAEQAHVSKLKEEYEAKIAKLQKALGE